MRTLGIAGGAFTGGAIQIIDAASDSYDAYVVYDDDSSLHGKEDGPIFVKGCINEMKDDFDCGFIDSAIVAIGSIKGRSSVYKRLVKSNIKTVNVISRHAIISPLAKIGSANVILPTVYIGPKCIIGDNNFITTGTYVNHDSVIGDDNYFSTGVKVAGRVKVGNKNRFDTGSIILADHIVGDSRHLFPGIAYGPQRSL